ncbi:2,3-diaminopropionate biosynthesis protein SbnA [Photorhabdus tasmaniensis]
MIYESCLELIFDDVFLKIEESALARKSCELYMKLEGFSIGGSIKIKPALNMIKQLELRGRLSPGGKIIESSSGNLGVALSIICAVKGYKFICVVDPNVLEASERLMKIYGADVIKVREKDKNGGYLGTRISVIKNMLKEDSSICWTNQYENMDNVNAHYLTTAQEIYKSFPKADYIFVGAGTTGTLSGISQFTRKYMPNTKVITVDTLGSVTFGGKKGKRRIPGLGTSIPPEISKYAIFDDLIMVEESETIKACSDMAGKGILFGGSTGSVISAIRKYSDYIPDNSQIIAISPDFGERYLDIIYSLHSALITV